MAITLPILAPAAPARPSLSHRLEPIRAQLVLMDDARCHDYFALPDSCRLLKSTISLCPDCLEHVPAAIYTLAGRVLMKKRCDAHGFQESLIENDAAFYRLSSKDRWGRRYADEMLVQSPAFVSECCSEGGCTASEEDSLSKRPDATDQWANKSCTVLVEVTNACNLACPVCYSDARGDRKMPLEDFKRHITRLLSRKESLDSVQLTGGEALLHPEFWEMVAFLHQLERVKRIYLPTNGILLARPGQARRLLPFRDKLMVLLQFDGQERATNDSLRAANTLHVRQRVVDELGQLDIAMQLTMTIAAGVNDAEVGWVVDTVLKNRAIKLAALQPVTYSGRYDLPPDPMNRSTLSDVAKAVVAQASKRIDSRQFVPIPCSHPNCGWITLFARRFGLTVNIVDHIDMNRARERASYKTVLSTGQLREIVGTGKSFTHRIMGGAGRKLVRAKDVVAIAIKPFMDRFNYDQDRISACCHHLLDTAGEPVSFCEYNALLRANDSWENRPPLSSGGVRSNQVH